MKMLLNVKYSIFISLLLFFSCSIIRTDLGIKRLNHHNWIIYRSVYSDAGFVIEFKYPNNLVIADQIDYSICVGTNTQDYNKNEASSENNTRQWCISVLDSADYSVDYLIASWKTALNGDVLEIRDTVTIGNSEAIRVTLKTNKPNVFYRQLVYLKKYSTLFEVMNVDESTSKDFELYCKSIKIEGNKKQ